MNIAEKIREKIAAAMPDNEHTGKVYYDKDTDTYKRRPADVPVDPEDRDYDQALVVRAERLMRRHDASQRVKMNRAFRRRQHKARWDRSTLQAQADVLSKGEEYWAARGQGAMFWNVYNSLERRLKAEERVSA